MTAAPEEAHLRIAPCGESIVLDLGTPDGRAVVIDATGWRVVDPSPVLFRRSELTSPMPTPEPDTDGTALGVLRGLLNISDDDWHLVLGWIIAALIPDLSHPILLTGGFQGTGKTTLAKLILGIVDPSPAPTRSPPSDIDGWSVTMRGSYSACLDNISAIPAWFSDALCCASTGAGLVKRSLYTDGDISVLTFRRALIITSIDPGALKGDLADRLVLIDLERIDPARRRTESDILSLFSANQARIIGAVLSLLAKVLRALPGIRLDSLPRMADFARVLAAMDSVAGTRALDMYLGQGQRLAEAVIDGDIVARAVADFTISKVAWSGTASELLTELTPNPAPKGWPRTPQHLSGTIKRAVPALGTLGVEVVFDRRRTADRKRLIHLKVREAESIVRTVRTVQEGADTPIADTPTGILNSQTADDEADAGGLHRPNHRPTKIADSAALRGCSDDADDADADSLPPSTSDAPSDPDDSGAFCSDLADGDTVDRGGA